MTQSAATETRRHGVATAQLSPFVASAAPGPASNRERRMNRGDLDWLSGDQSFSKSLCVSVSLWQMSNRYV